MDTALSPNRTGLISDDPDASVAQRLQALEQELQRAQALYEQSPSGQFTLDAEQRFSRVNQTLLDWLGYSREDMVGQLGFLDLIEVQQREAHRSQAQFLCSPHPGEPWKLKIQRKDGSTFPALLSSTPVCDAEGQFLHSHATLVDLSGTGLSDEGRTSQENFLLAITNRIPARLSYYDKNLICRFTNLAQAARYGKQPADLVGSHLTEVVHPELMSEILPRVAEALSGKPQLFEAERVSADGIRNFFEIHYIPDTQLGSVEGIFIEVHDISERRRTEEFVLEANRDLEERVRESTTELFESEQRYRLMVDAIQDYCIYFVNEEGLVTDWTESAQRLHGYERKQMLGKPYQQLISADNAGEDETDAEQVMRLAKAHGQWETRGWRLRDDGSRFWAHTVLTALRNEAGDLQGLSSITRDMTAAKCLEDVMNDLNKELEKRVAERTQQLVAANKDLDVFSHMISHDLRAPLRHISSFATLLQEQLGEAADKASKQYLASIFNSSKRMSHMLEGLLEYARIGRVALDTQPVPLNPLLDGVIAHLKSENPDRKIEWVIEDDLPVVRGDAMLLAQAWGNVLSNSVKYSRPREVAHIRVGWKVNPVGGRTFYVQDDGVGFDLEKAHNLYVMFQRQHHSMDFEGTGTGLALAQRIFERHGGRIWAETSPGEGCTFYFTLPFEGLEPEPELAFAQSAMAELTD